MDVLYGSADTIDVRNVADAYTVGLDEAEMLSFGFDFSDWDTPSNSSNSRDYTGIYMMKRHFFIMNFVHTLFAYYHR